MKDVELTLTASINQLVERYGFEQVVSALVEHCERHIEDEELLEGGELSSYWQDSKDALIRVLDVLER